MPVFPPARTHLPSDWAWVLAGQYFTAEIHNLFIVKSCLSWVSLRVAPCSALTLSHCLLHQLCFCCPNHAQLSVHLEAPKFYSWFLKCGLEATASPKYLFTCIRYWALLQIWFTHRESLDPDKCKVPFLLCNALHGGFCVRTVFALCLAGLCAIQNHLWYCTCNTAFQLYFCN